MTMTTGVKLASALVTGCVAGGGPYVAYGEHGWSTGAEGGGGFAIAEANVGLDVRPDRTSVYVRGDVVPLADVEPPDELAPFSARPGPSLRLGAGWSFADAGGLIVVGGGASAFVHRSASCNPTAVRLGDLSIAGTVELQVRYTGGWSVALAPRVDARAIHCEGT